VERRQALSNGPGWWGWLKSRSELLIPVLGSVLFLLMSGSQGPGVGLPITALVLALAAAHVVWIVRVPEKLPLPEKTPRPVERRDIWRTLGGVTAVVAAGAGISLLTSALSGETGESSYTLAAYLAMLALIALTATAGLLAERGLPVDLIPVLRQRSFSRLGYALVSSVFIAFVVMVVGGVLSSNIASGVASLLGEAPVSQDAAAGMDTGRWFVLFLDMLIGAGLFEELLFRAGVMTLVWRITGKWGWGLAVSAALFGFYHITLSGLSGQFLEAPVYSVVNSALMGLFLGHVYRKRGLTTVVLVHGLMNFASIMLFS
jgi:membrane protease YdiL (CAAX protease family)